VVTGFVAHAGDGAFLGFLDIVSEQPKRRDFSDFVKYQNHDS
jgi:hypothetical protein